MYSVKSYKYMNIYLFTDTVHTYVNVYGMVFLLAMAWVDGPVPNVILVLVPLVCNMYIGKFTEL